MMIHPSTPPHRHDICIVGGAGHIGLPLAIILACSDFHVLAYDIDEVAIKKIQQGIVPFMEAGAEPLLRQALAEKRLCPTTNPAEIQGIQTLIVTIGTPVDDTMNPLFTTVRDCIDELLPYLKETRLIILRSTVYPGTTDWLDQYLHEKGIEVQVAYCPERVVQGRAIEEIKTLPQIVSGTTKAAEDAAGELFARIAPEIVRLTPIEAEFAKLFSNAWRYIQFAVANQFYMMTNSVGVDYYRVLAGMKQGYPRAAGIPRAGFAAGPCLFKDTTQLTVFASNLSFSLGKEAIYTNEGMVTHIADEIAKYPDAENLRVGILGMTFKADIDDIRSSLSYKLKRILEFQVKQVLCHDPHVRTDDGLASLEYLLEHSDILVLGVPHSAYQNLDIRDKPVIDIWGYLSTTRS